MVGSMCRLFASLLLTLAAPFAFAATSGIVASPSGDPIVGATVTLRRAQPVMERRASLLAGENVTIASATTNESGAFTFDGKLDGIYALDVRRDGFVPQAQPILAGSTDLNFVLLPVKSRTGHVTANGKPVANARVLVSAFVSVRYDTKTDERGVYTIPAPDDWANEIVIVHPDFAIHTINSVRGSLDAELTKGIVIEGKVVDQAAKPVANARVVTEWTMTTSSAEGAFRLRVKAEPEAIEAFAGDAAGIAKKGATTITLAPLPTISGSVRDANKRPLAGAFVRAVLEKGGVEQSAVADERGNYRIQHVREGSYYAGAIATRELLFEDRNNVEAGAKNVDFVAKPMDALTGTVVDEQKKPVAGAIVQYSTKGVPLVYGSSRQESAGALTGTDGRFRLPFAAEMRAWFSDIELQLQATKRGFAIAVVAADLKKPVTIVLPKGIEVRGLVVDADGNAVPGAGIAVAQGSMTSAPLPLDSAMSAGVLTPFLQTDAEGKFTIHLGSGRHDLGVWKTGAGGARLGDLEVTPGMDPLRIALRKGVAIRGRVMDGASPVKGGMIGARGTAMSFASAVVNEDGTFVIEAPEPGVYEITFQSDEDTLQETVTAPADDVVLTLAGKGSVHGRVLDAATRQPIRTFDVTTADAYNVTSVEDEPEFTLPLRAGDTELVITAKGYQRATQHVTVMASKTTEVTVLLTKGRTLRGRITSDDGSPLEDVMVSAGEAMSDAAADGMYEITLPATAQTLEVSATGAVRKTIAIGAGTTDSQRDVVLSRGRSVRGRVVAPDGTGAHNAIVSAFSTHAYQQAHTDEDGAFAMTGLTAEPYDFTAMHATLGSAERQSIDIGSVDEVILRIAESKGRGTVTGIVRGFEKSEWMMAVVQSGGRTAYAGRDGRYRLENLPAGEIDLRLMAQTANGDVATQSAKITLADGGEAEANFDLRAEASVHGVVNEGDEPAKGRSIRFVSGEAARSTRTGANGEYEIKAMDAGTYEVTVSTSGNRTFTATRTIKGNDRFDIRIEWSRIEGRVVDEQGTAIDGAELSIFPSHDSSRSVETKSDSTGAFIATFAQASSVTVRAEKAGFTTTTQQFTPGAAPIVLTMQRGDGLRVRLVDARDGRTLDGYAVAVNDAGAVVARASDTASDGTLTVPVPSGTYRIAVSATNYASSSMRATVPRQGELRFSLTPGGTLIVNSERALGELVKLILPGGEEYVRCQCNGIAEIRLTGKTTTIAHVAPGTYTMQVLDENHAIKGSYPVSVTEGQTTTVHF
jgi:small nuclear ribonucleoprotein (snRNP)-like protein